MIHLEKAVCERKRTNWSWHYKHLVQKLSQPLGPYVIVDSHLLSREGHSCSWLSNGVADAGQVRWVHSTSKSVKWWIIRHCYPLGFVFMLHTQTHTQTVNSFANVLFLAAIYGLLPKIFKNCLMTQDTNIIASIKQWYMNSNQIIMARKISFKAGQKEKHTSGMVLLVCLWELFVLTLSLT